MSGENQGAFAAGSLGGGRGRQNQTEIIIKIIIIN